MATKMEIPKGRRAVDFVKDRASAEAWGLVPMKKDDPRRTMNRYKSIKAFLNKLHDEEAPGELLTVFRKYFPHITRMTMREAWLRTIYLEAIGGTPWASLFVADRSEGRVGEGGMHSDKGEILAGIEDAARNPVTDEIE